MHPHCESVSRRQPRGEVCQPAELHEAQLLGFGCHDDERDEE